MLTNKCCWLLVFATAIAMVVLPILSPAQPPRPTKPSLEQPKFLGPGSCSATACHGGVQPRSLTKVLQNEYSTWVVKDRHSRATTVLTQPIAQRMGRILQIGAPEKSPQCLTCHALYVPSESKGREFDINEGVSCESCHGPSSAWLGERTQPYWTHQQSLALGMYDTKNLVKRSEKCLSCHLGTAQRQVDHEMIAAGHPDLIFELDSYTAVEPPHWVEKSGTQKNSDPLFAVRAWSVGQAVQLRESLYRLVRHARSQQWPEFSELDCFTCHHSLSAPENSWRQERGYRDRRPGAVRYNDSRFVVLRQFVREVDGNNAQQLEANMRNLAELIAQSRPNREELLRSAESAAQLSSGLGEKLERMQFDRARTGRLLKQISSLAGPDLDERSAEQTAMAIDSLYTAYAKEAGSSNAEVRIEIDALFKEFENPSAYNPNRFRLLMTKLSAVLP